MKEIEVRIWPSLKLPQGWDYQCITKDNSYRGGGVREATLEAAQSAIRAALAEENLNPKFIVGKMVFEPDSK